MVLLAGDLFHDNKPTRRTLHKTMEIIKRYTMGPDPVQIQILSENNFEHGDANYLQEFYSVDLPIFSIHGNHDDPTRDGNDLLASLDILSVSHLVNYFGRQEIVDKVEIAPILFKKGDTQVALYGMGSLRDERLNRMWQRKKVRFQRPSEGEWFNIFVLHQNRDLGRGSKNCVHETMIPEWMDLIVWGHEHECLIQPSESVVGTFRITQPGSSVATSLSAGESIRKHVGVLDVRHNQFRLTAVPLVQVRSFMMGEVSLNGQDLDPEDPKIDDQVTQFLENEVEVLIHEVKEKRQELLLDAKEQGNNYKEQTDLKYKLKNPDDILVRLRVEHSGFTTLNNQRFGARFVGRVANLSGILLFHRKKETSDITYARKKRAMQAIEKPIVPDDHKEMNIEDLVMENLDMSDKKLEMLDEAKLNIALEEFVSKEIKQALSEATKLMLRKHQKKLISGESKFNEDVEEMDWQSKSTQSVQEAEYDVKVEIPVKLGVISQTQRSTTKSISPCQQNNRQSGAMQKLQEDDKDVTRESSRKSHSQTKRRSMSRITSNADKDYEVDEIIELKNNGSEKNYTPKKRTKCSTMHLSCRRNNKDGKYDEIMEIISDRSDKVKKPFRRRKMKWSKCSPGMEGKTNKGGSDEKFGNSYGVDVDWDEANTNSEKLTL